MPAGGVKRGAPLKRTELRRSSSLPRGGGLQRTAMRAWKPKRRVVAAKETAYALVDARDGDQCAMCGDYAPKGQREHSHRSHAGIGGSPASLRASNLLLSCWGCNRALSDDAGYATVGRRFGWLIGRGADSTTTPVFLWRRGWVLLNDEGTYTPTKETL